MGVSSNDIYFWIAGLILNLLMQAFFETQIWTNMMFLEIKIRVACSSLIYNKVLRLSKIAFESQTSVGQVYANYFLNYYFRCD